jgi:hypothetical protein
LGGNRRFEEFAFEIARRHRPPEEIALAFLAAHTGEQVGGGAVPPDNTARDLRVLFSLSNAFKLCPERAATRCL